RTRASFGSITHRNWFPYNPAWSWWQHRSGFTDPSIKHISSTAPGKRAARRRKRVPTKYLLTEDQLPDHWYNILADLPEPLGPFLSPQTLAPLTPPDLTPLF